jgi:hypothetical protein
MERPIEETSTLAQKAQILIAISELYQQQQAQNGIDEGSIYDAHIMRPENEKSLLLLEL